jgi:hypothetical protein
MRNSTGSVGEIPPGEVYAGNTLEDATTSVNRLSAKLALRIVALAAFLEPFEAEKDAPVNPHGGSDRDFPKYRLFDTIDHLIQAGEKLKVIERYIGIPNQRDGQVNGENGSIYPLLNSDSSIILKMSEFRAMIKDEVKRAMPRGFPGTGPYAGKNKPKSAATKAPAKKAAKAATKPKAKATAKAKAPAKKAAAKKK